MPKTETVEYFNILIVGVPPTELGATMASLAKLGHTNVRPELVTEVAAFKQRSNHSVSGENYLIDWLADHPTFKIKEAVAHFKADGRSAGSCYTAARVLVQRHLLKKLGEGNYTRAGVKALAAPKKASPKKSVARVVYEPPHPAFAMRLISRNHGRCTRQWLKDQFDKEGRPGVSAPAALASLIRAKQIKRVAEGEYELIRKKANGAAVTEAAHG